MLERLELKHVGPADEMTVELAPRLNFFTGDNGIGKTFLLDVAWWLVTHTWAREAIVPHRDAELPEIRSVYGVTTPYDNRHLHQHYRFNFSHRNQTWHDFAGRERTDETPLGLLLYAQLDGGFASWDPFRNDSWSMPPDESTQPRPPAYLFRPDEIWNGLENGNARLCNGLIRDWAYWQERTKDNAFEQLTAVLKQLSPPDHALVPGDLVRISLDDVRDHPTIRMAYGQDVALVHASAAIRRIAALAYLLIWNWQEHCRAAKLLHVEPARHVTFLVDEIDAHLHPQWQRAIVPALLDVMKALSEDDVEIQVLGTTHSPLVLASVEPHARPGEDALFELDLVEGQVELTRSDWPRRGDVNSWLTSSVFDNIKEARSLEDV